jgi:hypothetical protein
MDEAARLLKAKSEKVRAGFLPDVATGSDRPSGGNPKLTWFANRSLTTN